MTVLRRRRLLRATLAQLGVVTLGPSLLRCTSTPTSPTPAPPVAGDHFPPWNPPAITVPQSSNVLTVGPLGEPNELGLRLPAGFTARIVARSGELVQGTDHVWHNAPDGGATFLAEDGGYVYVSNSEGVLDAGAGALRFDADGQIVDAYWILQGTMINCAGGPTPWGTWLSCEERDAGEVHECDPFGQVEPLVRPALGVFKHEAVAVDPDEGFLYLTEDESDGRFYRFRADRIDAGRPSLDAGTLEVMRVLDREAVLGGGTSAVEWLPVSDHRATTGPTRTQVPVSTPFDGGEGIWWHDGVVFFTTKGDHRLWAYDARATRLELVYDAAVAASPILTGVDNVTVSGAGDILVAEDGGDMQIVAVAPDGATLVPLVQVIGQDDSEITGPAFDPYRRRLYFSSQRGSLPELNGAGGITYEITGPFFS